MGHGLNVTACIRGGQSQVPLFVNEPGSEAVSVWFGANAETLVAADWLVTEFASALSIKVGRG